MATFFTKPEGGTITGTSGDDLYIVDPENLGNTVIRDFGGNDTIRVFDPPGRTAGEFLITSTVLIWRNFEGDEVRFLLGTGRKGMIETFEWDSETGDGQPFTLRSTIVIGTEGITQAKVAVVGTSGDDVFTAPDLPAPVGSWSEIYGNAGNDILTASDDHSYQLYGGKGQDTLLGKGTFDDWIVGDGGSDVLRGRGGKDHLEGGAWHDSVYGGAGADNIRGNEGNDRLSGGGGADRFAFKPGFEEDRIVDYGNGWDVLVFEGGLERSNLSVRQVGANVEITYDGGDGHIVVVDTLKSELRFDFG